MRRGSRPVLDDVGVNVGVNVAALLDAEVRRDGARPFLTWYDDATGERVELSVLTLANWAVKTANFLADEHGVEPGDAVSLAPSDHWLSYVAVLGAWCVGARLAGDAAVVLPGDPAAFMSSVLPQPDALMSPPADVDWDGGDTPDGARILSTLPLSSPDGLRLSLTGPLTAHGSVVMVTNADASRLADRARMERVTHTAGCDVGGVSRLD